MTKNIFFLLLLEWTLNGHYKSFKHLQIFNYVDNMPQNNSCYKQLSGIMILLLFVYDVTNGMHVNT